jgi:hypothetical protein
VQNTRLRHPASRSSAQCGETIRNVDRPTPYPPDITSVGAGLRWLIGPGTTAELYYGRALRYVPVGTSLQDRGIHFRLTAAFF